MINVFLVLFVAECAGLGNEIGDGLFVAAVLLLPVLFDALECCPVNVHREHASFKFRPSLRARILHETADGVAGLYQSTRFLFPELSNFSKTLSPKT